MMQNLVSGAWIPVRRRDGARQLIRPAQIVDRCDDNPIISPDWPRPDLNVATLEFLIGLFSVAVPPDCFESWFETWNSPPTVDALDQAFAPYESAFNLDGDGPLFMQDFDVLDGEPTGIEGLFIDSAGENTVKKNADLMVKRQRYSYLSRPAAAIALYALQQFAPTGGAGHRTSMRGGGPLTTLALPPAKGGKLPSVWSVVWVNIREVSGGALDDQDLLKTLPWLASTHTSENQDEVHEGDEKRVTSFQAFFGMPRRIRLVFEDNREQRPCDLTRLVDEKVIVGYVTRPYGINYGQWRHPLTPYYRKKEEDEEAFAMHPPAGRFGYRNWVSVVAGDDGYKLREPAAVIRNCRDRMRNAPKQFANGKPQLLIAGWAMNNMKPLDYVFAEQPFHFASDEKHAEAIDGFTRRLVASAERASGMLVGAFQVALMKSGRDKPKADSARITAARDAFFADTENKFHEILGAVSEQSDFVENWHLSSANAWLATLRITALKIFDANIQPDPSDPDRARKVVIARNELRRKLFGGPLKSELDIPTKIDSKSKTVGAVA